MDKGREGELLAEKYLCAEGYEILDRNFHSYFGEIDIVAGRDSTVIFVEVKFRTGTSFGFPEEYVTRSKMGKIRKTAEYYLMKKNRQDSYCRFDVVAITGTAEKHDIKHLKDVF